MFVLWKLKADYLLIDENSRNGDYFFLKSHKRSPSKGKFKVFIYFIIFSIPYHIMKKLYLKRALWDSNVYYVSHNANEDLLDKSIESIASQADSGIIINNSINDLNLLFDKFIYVIELGENTGIATVQNIALLTSIKEIKFYLRRYLCLHAPFLAIKNFII